jgi:hypothetical protein
VGFGKLPSGLLSVLRLRLEESFRVEESPPDLTELVAG